MGAFHLNMHTYVCLHMYICVWCCSACRNIYTSTHKHTHAHTHTQMLMCVHAQFLQNSSTPSPDHTLIIQKNSKTQNSSENARSSHPMLQSLQCRMFFQMIQTKKTGSSAESARSSHPMPQFLQSLLGPKRHQASLPQEMYKGIFKRIGN